MARPLLFSAMIFIAAGTAGGASAHPGAKIITTGSGAARVDVTGGVTVEEIKGVHVYRGGPSLAGGDAPPVKASIEREIEIKIVAPKCVWRSFRSLRTQGFYSGTGPKSRRYTQGFYSGR